MPGHKGSGFFVRMGYGDAFGQGEAGIADLDITEIPGADDLRKADSVIKEVILLDTISIPEDKKLDKFTILPVAPVFAEAIERIYEDKPVSSIGV